MGKIFVIQFTEMEFIIWRVTFLKSCLPLRNYGMDFRFFRTTVLERVHASEMSCCARISFVSIRSMKAFLLDWLQSLNFVSSLYLVKFYYDLQQV